MKQTLFFVFCISIMLTSCGNYQRVLKGDDNAAKFKVADSLYQLDSKGKYRKALKLMEQIVPVYRGKPQAEKLMFMYANTFYELEDYFLAGYQFERFETSYPKSDSVEVAAYKSAKSYYELSPRYSLEQKDTYKGLEKLQVFVNKYPNSQYREEANVLVKELREKLEKKDIEVADQYLLIANQVGSYKPAIESYENFISDHPGSIYREDAFYGRIDAAYNRALSSVPQVVEERLITAKGYYNQYIKYYKVGARREDADALLLEINKRLSVYEVTTTEN
ncbi:outer membrane protein assembly factor BamD [Patiriisocius marinus]|nr:outer membrane protein assembly factor BamD [Patiriisocius marinus]